MINLPALRKLCEEQYLCSWLEECRIAKMATALPQLVEWVERARPYLRDALHNCSWDTEVDRQAGEELQQLLAEVSE